jgi:hypothetical protein
MLFGYNKNFSKPGERGRRGEKENSGQIKCLAFRSFNEKKVLNECDEREEIQ